MPVTTTGWHVVWTGTVACQAVPVLPRWPRNTDSSIGRKDQPRRTAMMTSDGKDLP